jgi:uncharacterized membrane protein YphA (DoxX/SURF4 family)
LRFSYFDWISHTIGINPLLIIMITALISTKIVILLNKGFWQMAHDSRTDFAMTLLLIFLIIYGAGKWSVDSRISGKN